jgi:hypothetical protein
MWVNLPFNGARRRANSLAFAGTVRQDRLNVTPKPPSNDFIVAIRVHAPELFFGMDIVAPCHRP